MIRNIVGTGVEIAVGKLNKNTITESFFHKNRNLTGMCAPAWALTLIHVYYDKETMAEALKFGARSLVPC